MTRAVVSGSSAMADRPTSITLPLRWERNRNDLLNLMMGHHYIGAVGTAGSGWLAVSNYGPIGKIDLGLHPTAEAAQIALEQTLIEAVGATKTGDGS